jgi:predicted membrane-bound mannosyltransferase
VLSVLAGVLLIAGITVSRFTFCCSRLLLLILVLLAFALRVHRLGAQSLWYDEAVTAQ